MCLRLCLVFMLVISKLWVLWANFDLWNFLTNLVLILLAFAFNLFILVLFQYLRVNLIINILILCVLFDHNILFTFDLSFWINFDSLLGLKRHLRSQFFIWQIMKVLLIYGRNLPLNFQNFSGAFKSFFNSFGWVIPTLSLRISILHLHRRFLSSFNFLSYLILAEHILHIHHWDRLISQLNFRWIWIFN